MARKGKGKVTPAAKPTPKWSQLAPPFNPMEATERAFWQSRSNLRDPPELTDLEKLARDVRGYYGFIENRIEVFNEWFLGPMVTRCFALLATYKGEKS